MMLIASHGTKKSRQNGPNKRMIPTRSPEGQTLNVRMPRILTPSPMEPDCQRIRRSGSASWSGNLELSQNQPENTARIVVTVSHSAAKNSGKKTAKFCSRKLINLRPPSVSPPPSREQLDMAAAANGS